MRKPRKYKQERIKNMAINTLNETVATATEAATDLGANVAKTDMYTDVIGAKVKQVQGRLQESWGALTDNNSDRFYGRRDQLIGMLQEKYGYSRIQATDFLNDFVNEAVSTEERAASALRNDSAEINPTQNRSAAFIGLVLVAAGAALFWRSKA
jgi:uncharacterized protein YjbJ (UPF0337 family)